MYIKFLFYCIFNFSFIHSIFNSKKKALDLKQRAKTEKKVPFYSYIHNNLIGKCNALLFKYVVVFISFSHQKLEWDPKKIKLEREKKEKKLEQQESLPAASTTSLGQVSHCVLCVDF